MAAVTVMQAPAASGPICYLYGHLHNTIRAELDTLSGWVLGLEPTDGVAKEADMLGRLLQLKERYGFLKQVYAYHSSVEDEVVYPALDSKVRNVTLAYSVEHQDEVRCEARIAAHACLCCLHPVRPPHARACLPPTHAPRQPPLPPARSYCSSS